jgi:hypothetical protein
MNSVQPYFNSQARESIGEIDPEKAVTDWNGSPARFVPNQATGKNWLHAVQKKRSMSFYFLLSTEKRISNEQQAVSDLLAFG